MKNENVKNLALSAMFITLGLVLPFLTGQIPQIGKMMLPMHIPVLLCGLICGWKYGAIVGITTPLLRSVVFVVPVLYPTAIVMAVELMTYGLVIGFLYGRSRWKCIIALYRCLIIAMISGRLAKAVTEIMLLGIGGDGFTYQAFIAGAFLNAIPGIIIQLILIPTVMVALNRTGLVSFGNGMHKKHCCVKSSERD